MTSDDLWRVTDENCRLGHHLGPKPTPFRVNGNVPMRKEVVEILPIDLTWAGHEIDLTSGHEYKKSMIYKLLELLTSSTFKSLKTLGS